MIILKIMMACIVTIPVIAFAAYLLKHLVETLIYELKLKKSKNKNSGQVRRDE